VSFKSKQSKRRKKANLLKSKERVRVGEENPWYCLSEWLLMVEFNNVQSMQVESTAAASRVDKDSVMRDSREKSNQNPKVDKPNEGLLTDDCL
jgi:hypothetical protein